MSNVTFLAHTCCSGATMCTTYSALAISSAQSGALERTSQIFQVTEKSPAYVLGEKVVKPLIHKGEQVGGRVLKLVWATLSSIDAFFSKIIPQFPGAEAAQENFPLHKAVKEGNLKAVKKLINGKNIHQKNKAGDTPLHIACRKGHFEIVKLLTSYGGSVGVANNNNKNPYMIAKQCRHKKITNFLEGRVCYGTLLGARV